MYKGGCDCVLTPAYKKINLTPSGSRKRSIFSHTNLIVTESFTGRFKLEIIVQNSMDLYIMNHKVIFPEVQKCHEGTSKWAEITPVIVLLLNSNDHYILKIWSMLRP